MNPAGCDCPTFYDKARTTNDGGIAVDSEIRHKPSCPRFIKEAKE